MDVHLFPEGIIEEALYTLFFFLLIFVAQGTCVRWNKIRAKTEVKLAEQDDDSHSCLLADPSLNDKLAIELGTASKCASEIVDTILNVPRKMYLGSFDRVLVLLSKLLTNAEPADPRCIDVIVKWLVERNPATSELRRILCHLHGFNPRILLEIVFKYGDAIGWTQFFRNIKRGKKLAVPILSMILDVVSELKSTVYFDLMLKMLPQYRYEVIQYQPVIQSLVNASIACKRLTVMEDVLLANLYCPGNAYIKWKNIFQSIFLSYGQSKCFRAANNFISKARQHGLPHEDVDCLMFGLQYEKTKIEKMESGHAEANDGTNHTTRKCVATPFSVSIQKDKLRPIRSVRWYTTAISDCGERGDWTQALQFLEEISHVGLKADTIAYSAAINACGKARQWEHALNLFQDMKSRCLPLNERVYGACLHACAKAKQWERALLLLEEMRRKGSGVKPNVYNYGAAMSACEYAREYSRVLELFERLKTEGLQPNLIVYSLAISACWKAEKDELAYDLFSEMRSRGIIPNSITYRLLHSGAAKNGNWARVEELKEDMKCIGILRGDDGCFTNDSFRRGTTLSTASTTDLFEQ